MAFNWQPFVAGYDAWNYAMHNTSSGVTQLILQTNFPGDGNLTEADADSVASALLTAIEGLSDVSSATQTAISVSTTYGATLVLPSSIWALYLGTAEISGGGSSTVWLAATFPHDGVLTQSDLNALVSNVVSTVEGLTGVTSFSLPAASVTPSTL